MADGLRCRSERLPQTLVAGGIELEGSERRLCHRITGRFTAQGSRQFPLISSVHSTEKTTCLVRDGLRINTLHWCVSVLPPGSDQSFAYPAGGRQSAESPIIRAMLMADLCFHGKPLQRGTLTETEQLPILLRSIQKCPAFLPRLCRLSSLPSGIPNSPTGIPSHLQSILIKYRTI